jgi:L-alanine-DL-glutamate epimerase-like enolase superfamily enzyme
MRLTNVRLDLPMIVEGMIPGTKGTVGDPSAVVDSLTEVLRERADARGVSLSADDLAHFRSGFLAHADRPADSADRLQQTGVRENFSKAVDLALADVGAKAANPALFEQLGPVRHEVKHAAAAAALRNQSEPSLTVEVRTEEVKARSDPQSITRLHFELNEDGLEWERETEPPKRKLVPE